MSEKISLDSSVSVYKFYNSNYVYNYSNPLLNTVQ